MKTFATWILLTAPLAAQDIVLQTGEARLCEQEVDAEIQHRIAVTRVRQVFENPGDRATEGIYSFRVPDESSLTGFTMWIGGHVMKGQIVDRDEARRIYDGIVAKARDPGIVEEIEPQLFRVRVFPIPPGGRMKFEITYVSPVPSEGERCTYVYPLRIAEHRAQAMERFSFDLRIAAAGEVVDVASATHSVNVGRKSEQEVHVAFDKRTALDRDIVVRYATRAAELPLLTHRRSGEDGHFALFLDSSGWRNVATPKEVVYLIDRSSSMSAKTLSTVKELLIRAVRTASQEDRIRVLAFNEAALTFEGSDAKALEKFLQPLGAEGRTDLGGAIGAALSPPSDRPRIVVVVSDGRPSAGALSATKLIADALRAADRRTVLFALRIGSGDPERILETLATLTGGESLAVGGDVASAWDRLHRTLARPFLTDVEIDWGGAPVDRVHPAVPRLLFAGNSQMLVGRYRKAGRYAVKLRGGVGDHRVEISQTLTFPEADARWGCAAYLWAGYEIRARLAEIAQGGDSAALCREVVSLSHEYQIVTPYTSFLVLENDEMYAQYGLERRLADDRRLFKRRAKKKLELIDESVKSVDLPSATPSLSPIDPLKGNSSTGSSLLRSLRSLADRRSDDRSSVDLGNHGRLDEAGTVALSLLALLGASAYELEFNDASTFEKAVAEKLAFLEARVNRESGRVGDSKSDLLNHVLATLALIRAGGASAQPAISYLCERPAKEWKRCSGTVAAAVRLAFAEARAAGLEAEESVLRFLPTRDFRRENPSLQGDPLSAWVGTEVLLSASFVERRQWRRSLEAALREDAKRAKRDEPAPTALRILAEEAYDRGD